MFPKGGFTMTPTPKAAPKSNFPGPLDYDTSNQLMNDFAFKGRIKVACMHLAVYIQGEAPATVAHNTRYEWALRTVRQPDISAQTVTPAVVMDTAVQAAGDAITDAALQTAVETAITAQM
jgi:hypothetical protein